MIIRWRLPDREELNQMYEILHKNGVGGFANDYYWSSSEFNANDAWFRSFISGFQDYSIKYNYRRVRAVRDFKSSIIYQLRNRGPSGGWIFHKDGNHYKECKDKDELLQLTWYEAMKKYPPLSSIEKLAERTKERKYERNNDSSTRIW